MKYEVIWLHLMTHKTTLNHDNFNDFINNLFLISHLKSSSSHLPADSEQYCHHTCCSAMGCACHADHVEDCCMFENDFDN
jgi:hypothetical protein